MLEETASTLRFATRMMKAWPWIALRRRFRFLGLGFRGDSCAKRSFDKNGGVQVFFGGAGIRATVYLGSINSGLWVLITPGTGSEQLRVLMV